MNEIRNESNVNSNQCRKKTVKLNFIDDG